MVLRWTMLSAMMVCILGVGVVAQAPPNASAKRVNNPFYVDMPYDVVPGHFKPEFPKGWTWGTLTGLYVESPDRIYVYQWGILPALDEFLGRDGRPRRDVSGTIVAARGMIPDPTPWLKEQRQEYMLTVFDRNGKMIEHWKDLDAISDKPHRIKVNPWDPEKHVWLIDEGQNGAIYKMTRTGKLVMKVSSDRETGCRRPQDIAFLRNGDFWCVEMSPAAIAAGDPVPDPRVIKFSKDGKKLTEFGRWGDGAGEIKQGHSIVADAQGRIYVGSRGNFRIQVFDSNGKFLTSYSDVLASTMGIDRDNRLWVACSIDYCGNSGASHGLSVFELNGGKQLFSWGVAGGRDGQLYGLSQIDVDRDGNVYMVEVRGGRVQMFRPKKNADPKHLIRFPFAGAAVWW